LGPSRSGRPPRPRPRTSARPAATPTWLTRPPWPTRWTTPTCS